MALTLPEDTIRALRQVDPDTGWAIVKLLEREPAGPSAAGRQRRQPDVELMAVAGGRSLIVVNRAVIRTLPGVQILPLTETRAFLALAPDRGMSDLELAVIDRLADRAVAARERRGLEDLRAQLTAWRRDRGLQFRTQAIIVVERVETGAARARGRARRPGSVKVNGSRSSRG